MNSKIDLSLLLPDFSRLLELSTPEGVSSTMVGLLIGIFSCFVVWSVIGYFRGKKAALFFIDLTQKLERDELSQTRYEINQKASANPNYGPIWREFDESLVLIEAENRLYNTIDAAHFFNTSNLARELTNNRLIAAVPAFLTALGVIATFAGLQLGLSSLSESTTNSSDIEGLSKGIFAMIGGASIAFMTSVWGVTLSLAFNAIEKGLERWVVYYITKLQRQIDYLYPRLTAEKSLVNLEYSSKESSIRLAELDEKIGNRLQEAMSQATTELRAGIEASLSQVLGPAVSKLVENANGASEKALEGIMEEFLSKVGSAGDEHRLALMNTSQAVQTSNQQMIEGVERLIEKIKESTAQSIQASDSFREIARANSTAVNGLNSAAEALQKTADAFGDHFGKLEEITTSLETIGKEAKSAFETASEAASRLNENQSSAMAAMEQTRVRLRELADILLNAQTRAGEGLTQVNNHFERVSESMKNHIASLEAQLSELLQSYSEQVNSQTTERLNAWNEQTNQYIGAMTNAVNALSGVVDDIDAKLSKPE